MPMAMVSDSGGGQLFHITKRAQVKKDFKELDETIRAKIVPFLYNQGEGKMVPIAQLACLRNRDRPPRKQVSRLAVCYHMKMTSMLSSHKSKNWAKPHSISFSREARYYFNL